MEYKEIKELSESKKILMKDVADYLGMTANGLKYSLENKKISYENISKLCNLLKITPAHFFGNTIVSGNSNITGNGNHHIDNRQYYSDNPDVLRAQIELLDARIKEKDSQIKEKDSQINSLLSILSKK